MADACPACTTEAPRAAQAQWGVAAFVVLVLTRRRRRWIRSRSSNCRMTPPLGRAVVALLSVGSSAASLHLNRREVTAAAISPAADGGGHSVDAVSAVRASRGDGTHGGPVAPDSRALTTNRAWSNDQLIAMGTEVQGGVRDQRIRPYGATASDSIAMTSWMVHLRRRRMDSSSRARANSESSLSRDPGRDRGRRLLTRYGYGTSRSFRHAGTWAGQYVEQRLVSPRFELVGLGLARGSRHSAEAPPTSNAEGHGDLPRAPITALPEAPAIASSRPAGRAVWKPGALGRSSFFRCHPSSPTRPRFARPRWVSRLSTRRSLVPTRPQPGPPSGLQAVPTSTRVGGSRYGENPVAHSARVERRTTRDAKATGIPHHVGCRCYLSQILLSKTLVPVQNKAHSDPLPKPIPAESLGCHR